MILLWTRDCSLVHLSIHPLIFRSIDLFVNADRIIVCIKQKLRNINLSREDFFRAHKGTVRAHKGTVLSCLSPCFPVVRTRNKGTDTKEPSP